MVLKMAEQEQNHLNNMGNRFIFLSEKATDMSDLR